MKTKYLILVLVAAAGSFYSCLNTTKQITIGQAGRMDINENEFVRIYFFPKITDLNSPTNFTVENNTEGILTFGDTVFLEYLNQEKWINIPLDIKMGSITFTIQPKNTRAVQFNFSILSAYFQSFGTYRIGKKFTLTYDTIPADTIKFNLFSEFEIN